MDEAQAYLDGRFIPASSATVSLADAGFVMGATVAEQVRTFAGNLFRLEDHLGRLRQSLRIVEVDPGVELGRLAHAARELVDQNHRLLASGDDLGLSIFVTPGAYPAYASSDRPSRPTVCMHTYPLPFRLWAEKYGKGQALMIADVQQVSPKTWPPELKCRSRMHYYLADRQAARSEPGARALLLDGQGLVTEASTANILVFRSTVGLLSPPHEKILPGISLAVVTEMARKLGIPTAQRDLTPQQVATAEEVLLTSTPFVLMPVTRFDGRLAP